MKKFELIGKSRTTNLYRIRALKDFDDVKAGNLGGFVEREYNLSQEGNCWIYDNARVTGNARLEDDAKIFNSVYVDDRAIVCDEARIYDDVNVSDRSCVMDRAVVGGYVNLLEGAAIFGDAIVSTHNCLTISGCARIGNNATIFDASDYVVVSGFGSEYRSTTFYRTKDHDIYVICGCFRGTLQQFREQVRKTHGNTKYANEYLTLAKLIEDHFK